MIVKLSPECDRGHYWRQQPTLAEDTTPCRDGRLTVRQVPSLGLKGPGMIRPVLTTADLSGTTSTSTLHHQGTHQTDGNVWYSSGH